jgi:hypothetical protein
MESRGGLRQVRRQKSLVFVADNFLNDIAKFALIIFRIFPAD